jgi:hypothetical protein
MRSLLDWVFVLATLRGLATVKATAAITVRAG